MTTSKAHRHPGETERVSALGRREQRATIVGSLLGGLAGAGFLYLTFPALYLRYVGLVLGIGPGSVAKGVVGFMVLAAAFGLLFGVLAARHVGSVARTTMGLAKSTDVTRSLLGPSFRRAPLTTTTTLVGLLYGVLLGVVVGSIAIPALVDGGTRFAYELPRAALQPVLAFVVYGGVLGFGYGRVVERGELVSVDAGPLLGQDTRALVYGVLVGAAAGGGALLVLAPGHLATVAVVVGIAPTTGAAVALWGLGSVLLSALFVGTAARSVSRGPSYAKGVTSAGFAYGIVLAVALGMLVVPHLANGIAGVSVDVPNTNLGTIVGYVVYGTGLGAAYGSVKQTGSLLPGEVREHRDAVVFASVLGGFLGGGVVYQAAGTAQMLLYGALVGFAGSVPRSWAVWMALTFLLGLGYVRYVRPRDESPGYLWRSTKRGLAYGGVAGVLVGGALVPALVNASTGFYIPVPNLDPMLVLGYVLFGGIVGAGYGASVDEDGVADGASTAAAVVFGSLLGGLMGGLIIHNFAGPVYIQFVGSLVGVEGSIAKSWATWLIVALVFGAAFERYVSPKLEDYVASMHEATENNPDLEGLLGSAMDGAELTTTTTVLGLAYGAGLAVVVGALALPFLVTSATTFSFPFQFGLDLAYLLGFVVYGGFLGAGYGAMLEF